MPAVQWRPQWCRHGNAYVSLFSVDWLSLLAPSATPFPGAVENRQGAATANQCRDGMWEPFIGVKGAPLFFITLRAVENYNFKLRW